MLVLELELALLAKNVRTYKEFESILNLVLNVTCIGKKQTIDVLLEFVSVEEVVDVFSVI